MPRTSAPRWRRIGLPDGSIRSSPPHFARKACLDRLQALFGAGSASGVAPPSAIAASDSPHGTPPRGACRSGKRKVPDAQPVEPARVRAALRAAALRSEGPLVLAALRAAADRAPAVRFCAADLACRASALFEAAVCPSRLSAAVIARERRVDAGFGPRAPAATARLALLRVFSEAAPFFGGGSFTPARRALDKPMAIACLVDCAPCLPSRT